MLDSEINVVWSFDSNSYPLYNYANFHPIIKVCQTVKLWTSEDNPNLYVTLKDFAEILFKAYANVQW